jgi:hypothetical protein
MALKRCFKCEQEKPLAEFYRHPRMGDGRLGKCKSCACADVRANRARRADYYRAYDRDRYTPNRESRMASARFRVTNRGTPEMRRSAVHALNRAIRDGKLEKAPCAECGKRSPVEAHHRDYAKPLDVVWLCITHHEDQHLGERC